MSRRTQDNTTLALTGQALPFADTSVAPVILYLTAERQNVMSKTAPGFLKPVFWKQGHHRRTRTVSYYAYMNSNNASGAITRHNPASWKALS